MKTIKLILRIVLVIILFPYGYPFFVFVFSMCGIAFFIAFFALLGIFLGWVSNDDKMIKEGKEGVRVLVDILIVPFILSYHFIKNTPYDTN